MPATMKVFKFSNLIKSNLRLNGFELEPYKVLFWKTTFEMAMCNVLVGFYQTRNRLYGTEYTCIYISKSTPQHGLLVRLTQISFFTFLGR